MKALSPSRQVIALPLATRFLSLVRYSDVYRHAENEGDGNKKDSASDVEVRATLDELRQMRDLVEKADRLRSALLAVADECRLYPDSPRSWSGDSYLPEKIADIVRQTLA